MGRSQFLKMCRDCAIMGPRLTGVQLNLIFERIHLESKEPIPGVRLGLSDWLQALLRISAQLYRECSPQEAFDQLLEQHVLHHTPAAAVTARQEDRLAQVSWGGWDGGWGRSAGFVGTGVWTGQDSGRWDWAGGCWR